MSRTPTEEQLLLALTELGEVTTDKFNQEQRSYLSKPCDNDHYSNERIPEPFRELQEKMVHIRVLIAHIKRYYYRNQIIEEAQLKKSLNPCVASGFVSQESLLLDFGQIQQQRTNCTV